MKVKFSKYQALGNDFIIFKKNEVTGQNPSLLAKNVCNRNYGIGADGMIILDDKNGHIMKFYNQDGSIAPMCGNGIRCLGKFIQSEYPSLGRDLQIDTDGGLMKVKILDDLVQVNLGSPRFSTQDIPARIDYPEMINYKLYIDNSLIELSSVFLGTSHCIIFVDDLDKDIILKLGPQIEKHPIFPLGINANFVKIIDSDNFEVVTWERGAGLTLACGTGASASGAIGMKLGILSKNLTAFLPGGKLNIKEIDNEIIMSGQAKIIGEGYYYLD